MDLKTSADLFSAPLSLLSFALAFHTEASALHPCGDSAACYQALDLRAQQTMALATQQIVIATWVGLFVTVIGTMLLFYTLRESRRATRYASDAAEAAQRAADVAERGLSEVNRPRLRVAIERIDFDNLGFCQVAFVVRNRGQFAGVLDRCVADLAFKTRFEAPSPEHLEIAQSRNAFAPLSTSIELDIGEVTSELTYERREQMSEPQRQDVDMGSAFLFFYGRIEYWDHLGNQRQHGFCFNVGTDLAVRPPKAMVGADLSFDRKVE